MTTEVKRRPEAEIDPQLHVALQSLLVACFADYPSRIYFKIPPHFRYVVTEGPAVLAQLGVELRVIRVGEQVLRTFAVVDVCVRDDRRGQGLASRLLAEVTSYATACGMDFVLLFADNDALYRRHGFVRVDNPLTWVKINDHRTIGLARAVTPHEMMIRPVTGSTWPTGEIDLLGHVF
ncbi:GNAT family N-acetyltransferase [Actinoplanes sp. HUAS TT8]|uniref:GNAT family N-acetyltransferase n=1 Tax=Actinoplanes sp. HUAS TT8 TaxID=3447453 RepID=UPI003F52336A